MTLFRNVSLNKLAEEIKSIVIQCSDPGCKHRLVQPMWGGRGLYLGNDWFCGSRCFERACRQRMLSLRTQPRRESRPAPRIPLGLLMLSRGYISQDQLRSAVQEQKSSGASMEAVLVHLGIAQEEQITSAIAHQAGYPLLSLKDRVLDVPKVIPHKLTETYSCLPVHYSATQQKLVLGFVHGLDHQVISAVEQITECSVSPCFMKPADFKRQSARSQTSVEIDEVVFERPGPIIENASTARSYAAQIGAERAKITLCPDYIWMRLFGCVQLDLLFRR